MPDGILLLDKPRGLSSNAALQRVRHLYGGAKAGHVGSLDPLASGMLPICLGEATKVAGEILAGRKCYRFRIALGSATTSGDAEGTVSATAPVPVLEAASCAAVLARFLGVHEQVPPMYSALKQGGTPLYRLARAGLSVPRAPRRIEIVSLTLLALEPDGLTLEALCSKGTYVRVLAQDIALALGTVGHVSELRRVYVEPFAGAKMWTLAELEGGPGAALLPSDWPLRELPQVALDAEGARRIGLGQQLVTALAGPLRCVRLYGPTGRFLGLGSVDGEHRLQPRRLFN
ncbi:MAG TPA: tRNA pseudouridine(55) synthase TruB [Steroidobacteraceae bacterium]|nr:tRNA pseudouridine(55) synthase TruB [Steroidobacteraceae bacterium]